MFTSSRTAPAGGAWLAAVLLCAAGPLGAATFSTSFEVPDNQNVTVAGDFTVDDGGVSAEFEGGTVFRAGLGNLYHSGLKSWMVDPTGVRGSTGSASATLSGDGMELTLFARNQSAAVTARVRVFDNAGTVIDETSLTHTDWTEISVLRNPGDAPIRVIVVENMSSGTGTDLMVAVDDFGFVTAADSGDDSDESSDESSDDESDTLALGPVLLLLIGITGAGLRRRRRPA